MRSRFKLSLGIARTKNSRKLAEMPGIWPNTVSAMIASLGDAKSFKDGRQVSAWLGLVPKQNSTSGKTVLFWMSMRGAAFTDATDPRGTVDDLRTTAKEISYNWLGRLLKRRTDNVAAVAI